MPRRREHLLFRNGELCERRVADHFGGGAAGRDAARYQPYGKEGLLIADIDLEAATGLLAARWRSALSLGRDEEAGTYMSDKLE